MDATLSHKREDLIWPYAQFVAQLLAREILGHKDKVRTLLTGAWTGHSFSLKAFLYLGHQKIDRHSVQWECQYS